MKMKIGDRVYVHGYVDEIRNDVVIIRNKGGYFGTAKSEIIPLATDTIPIKWIEQWLLDRNAYLERTTSEIIIKQMIDEWRAEQEKMYDRNMRL